MKKRSSVKLCTQAPGSGLRPGDLWDPGAQALKPQALTKESSGTWAHLSNLLVCKSEANRVQKKRHSVEEAKGRARQSEGWGNQEMRGAELRLGRSVTSEQDGENKRDRVGVRGDKHTGGTEPSFQAPQDTSRDNPGTEDTAGQSRGEPDACQGTERPAFREDNSTLKGSALGNSIAFHSRQGSGRTTEKTPEEELPAS